MVNARHALSSNENLPPPLPDDAALFLDFDGTLTDFAPQPDGVEVPLYLPGLMLALRERLDGALAIVTGRRLADIDRLLGPSVFAGAGLHGTELRATHRDATQTPSAGGIAVLAAALRDRFAGDSRIVVEDKGAAVAVHYRQAPQRALQCMVIMFGLVKSYGDLEIIRGSMVIEARPRGTDKGSALRQLMSRPPFLGRMPIFAGDDSSDEDGFRAAQELGGYGVKVHWGETRARYRCTSVIELHDWLTASVTDHS